jgi:acetyl-CoA carboxylase biotin carboxyl carrier protein
MMDVKDLKRLMDAMAAADVAELELEWDGSEERPGGRVALRRAAAAPVTGPAPAPPTIEAGPAPIMATLAGASGSAAVATPRPQAPTGRPRAWRCSRRSWARSTRRPRRTRPTLVRVGDRVKVGQVLCIIEAMKLMNEIEAEVAGTVVEILVRNEDPVEYGQVLFRIAPG